MGNWICKESMQNSQNKTIVGRFIDLNDQNIVLSIGGGASFIPLNSLSKDSQALAKKLKSNLSALEKAQH